jgi:methionyl-tRNA synthetase
LPARGDTFSEAARLLASCAELPSAIDEALSDFDLRRATGAVWDVVAEANRFASETRPWELAKAERTGDSAAAVRLDAVLSVLLAACTTIACELRPFLPDAADRVGAALAGLDVEHGRALFPKVPG